MNKLISIIIPVYKVEDYIHRCINSILNQTYKNLEVILVNDGSPDLCGEICEKYANIDKRVKVIHKTNGGLSSARNAGIKIATGEYIGFVDSDDWIEHNMYEHLYELINKYDADMSVARFRRVYNDKKDKTSNTTYTSKVYYQKEYMKKFFKIGCQECVYYAWNKLYKRNIIEKVEYPEGLTSEDVVGTYLILLNCNKIVESDLVIYNYFFNKDSITGKFSKNDFDLIKIWDRVVEISKNENKLYYEYAKLNRARIDFTLLTRLALNDDSSNDFQRKVDTIDLVTNLKNNKNILLSSKIPINRKILIILYCKNYEKMSRILNYCNRIKSIF